MDDGRVVDESGDCEFGGAAGTIENEGMELAEFAGVEIDVDACDVLGIGAVDGGLGGGDGVVGGGSGCGVIDEGIEFWRNIGNPGSEVDLGVRQRWCAIVTCPDWALPRARAPRFALHRECCLHCLSVVGCLRRGGAGWCHLLPLP